MARPTFPILEPCEFGISRVGLDKTNEQGILNEDEELFLYRHQGNELKNREFGSKNTTFKG